MKTPVSVPIAKILALEHRGLAEYIIKGLVSHRPILIPFVLDNTSIVEVARYLLRVRSGSIMSLYAYTNTLRQFSGRIGYTPDDIIADAKPDSLRPDPIRIEKHRQFLGDCLAELQDQGRSPGRLHGYSKHVRTFYKVNGIQLPSPYLPIPRPVYKDRAPTQEELSNLVDTANLREKLILSMVCLGGFREGTLTRLQYRHIKDDMEKHIVPLHVHVEAEITKGKYHDYDTFLGADAVDYLRKYLEARRKGGVLHPHIGPEEIQDDSPIIRDEMHDDTRGAMRAEPRSIGEKQVYKVIHQLYIKTGLLKPGQNHYTLRVHSLRKFFKTQLIAAGVPESYVDYMMGHTVDTYHDIQSKGVEFLRGVYAKGGVSIRPKTQQTAYEILASLAKQLGKDPDKVLIKESFSEPHRALADQQATENEYARIILTKLKELANS